MKHTVAGLMTNSFSSYPIAAPHRDRVQATREVRKGVWI
jgi:hypothetical protein